MVGETTVFTDRAHKRTFREGTGISYVMYPMRTAVIVFVFMDDEGVVAAALLHDVMGDAGVTREELEDAFGSRVAGPVVDESEDKSRSWRGRKTCTVRHLYTASWETKILALEGKLSNMHCMTRDCLMVGDAIWQRFSEKDRRKHTRCCWGIAHTLKELEDYLHFKECVMLCRTVFGENIISSDKDMMQRECE